jgi:hypothetical protein
MVNTHYRRSLERIGGLSAPGKMPCHSWSTPARACLLGKRMATQPGTVCHGCYALKGMYVMPNVQRAMENRLEILREAMTFIKAGDRFVADFANVLNKRRQVTLQRRATGKPVRRDGRYFRWHDSGDLQGLEHMELLHRICEATPCVQHWLPTREWGIVRRYLDTRRVPDNLTLRLSLLRVDDVPTLAQRQLVATNPRVQLSGVHSAAGEPVLDVCPAPTQEGECRECRECWATDKGVSYALH